MEERDGGVDRHRARRPRPRSATVSPLRLLAGLVGLGLVGWLVWVAAGQVRRRLVPGWDRPRRRARERGRRAQPRDGGVRGARRGGSFPHLVGRGRAGRGRGDRLGGARPSGRDVVGGSAPAVGPGRRRTRFRRGCRGSSRSAIAVVAAEWLNALPIVLRHGIVDFDSQWYHLPIAAQAGADRALPPDPLLRRRRGRVDLPGRLRAVPRAGHDRGRFGPALPVPELRLVRALPGRRARLRPSVRGRPPHHARRAHGARDSGDDRAPRHDRAVGDHGARLPAVRAGVPRDRARAAVLRTALPGRAGHRSRHVDQVRAAGAGGGADRRRRRDQPASPTGGAGEVAWPRSRPARCSPARSGTCGTWWSSEARCRRCRSVSGRWRCPDCTSTGRSATWSRRWPRRSFSGGTCCRSCSRALGFAWSMLLALVVAAGVCACTRRVAPRLRWLGGCAVATFGLGLLTPQYLIDGRYATLWSNFRYLAPGRHHRRWSSRPRRSPTCARGRGSSWSSPAR